MTAHLMSPLPKVEVILAGTVSFGTLQERRLLAVRFLSSQPAKSVPGKGDGALDKPVRSNVKHAVGAQDKGYGNATSEECDLFEGEWVPNPSGPGYTNETCNLIDPRQGCMTNGRPDTGYLYWRWSPRGCELPRFDARRFLDFMRNKAWAFVGDSISRNHCQSLLCLLSVVESPIRLYDDEYNVRYHFPSFNLSISVIWSPFLVKAAIFENHAGVSTSEPEVHLDELDPNWNDLFLSLDYAIISTGQWFPKHSIYYMNGTVIGCHNCNRTRTNATQLHFDTAYQKVLRHVMDRVATSGHRGTIFFQTMTPQHFENGEWNDGGTCSRTSPSKAGEFTLKEMNRVLQGIELGEFKQGKSKADKNGVDLKLLDFTDMNLMRPDGHPGRYGRPHPSEDKRAPNDCLHWCLPGPIDAWNDVIMQIAVNTARPGELR
ncbi:hypothetical protein MLD38_027670 [Melastoma candidum]|uniref:Uncharacterized protein n=1 Tax=Melastoma candidum TaxID=119954 RepID=A0ACB9P2Z2_9MYRT|nr:hypothetical protein MLD38_027670 [Melastoma candidum]